jgi:hypothetical protein
MNPRPEDYEDSQPKRYASEREWRQRLERCAPNTFLLKGASTKINSRGGSSGTYVLSNDVLQNLFRSEASQLLLPDEQNIRHVE